MTQYLISIISPVAPPGVTVPPMHALGGLSEARVWIDGRLPPAKISDTVLVQELKPPAIETAQLPFLPFGPGKGARIPHGAGFFSSMGVIPLLPVRHGSGRYIEKSDLEKIRAASALNRGNPTTPPWGEETDAAMRLPKIPDIIARSEAIGDTLAGIARIVSLMGYLEGFELTDRGALSINLAMLAAGMTYGDLSDTAMEAAQLIHAFASAGRLVLLPAGGLDTMSPGYLSRPGQSVARHAIIEHDRMAGEFTPGRIRYGSIWSAEIDPRVRLLGIIGRPLFGTRRKTLDEIRRSADIRDISVRRELSGRPAWMNLLSFNLSQARKRGDLDYIATFDDSYMSDGRIKEHFFVVLRDGSIIGASEGASPDNLLRAVAGRPPAAGRIDNFHLHYLNSAMRAALQIGKMFGIEVWDDYALREYPHGIQVRLNKAGGTIPEVFTMRPDTLFVEALSGLLTRHPSMEGDSERQGLALKIAAAVGHALDAEEELLHSTIF